jgi:hypothetical protein
MPRHFTFCRALYLESALGGYPRASAYPLIDEALRNAYASRERRLRLNGF